jgi:o-succinylbenzoate synthase
VKIEEVHLYHVSMPLKTAFETSFGRILKRECILVEVRSGDWYGWGECTADRDPGYSYETTQTAWHILEDFLAPGLLAQEDSTVESFRARSGLVRGHHLAKAGMEMALWDINGRFSGKSLQEMLGGRRRQVEVGVSVGLQASSQELVEVVSRYIDQGYQRVKIKIKPGRDISEAQAIRKAFPDLRLQVDANSAYDLKSAETLKAFDDLDLLLIEQPLAEDDLWDHHQLQKKFSTPICLDESITTLRHARQALEMEACRIINIKPGRLGGLSQGAAVHDLCSQRGIPVWCGGMLETGVGRASNLALASLANFTLPGDISATQRYYDEDITEQNFYLNPNSTIDVPQGAGLGVELNRLRLGKFTLRNNYIK